MKTALLKLQEESKPKAECTKSVFELIQQIESKQDPEKAEAPTAEEECDWVAKGNHVLDTQPDKLEGDKRTDVYIKACKKEWALAVCPNQYNPYELELMACVVRKIAL